MHFNFVNAGVIGTPATKTLPFHIFVALLLSLLVASPLQNHPTQVGVGESSRVQQPSLFSH